MDVRTQRKVDNYIGRLGIAVLRPLAMLLGLVLRRDHRLTVGKEVVWVKMLGGGSLLLAMPTLLGFRRAHPRTRMVLITTPAVKPFAELIGVFDEYRIIDNRGALRILWTALVALVRTWRADTIVDLEVHSRLTTVFTTLTMARNRVSFWLEDIFWRRGLASHLIFFNRSSGSYHFYDRISELFGVPVATRDDCRSVVLAACGIREPLAPVAGRVCIGFSCSDLSRERMLSVEHWVQVFHTNLRTDTRAFAFLGARGDRPDAEAIIARLRAEFPELAFENWCGELTLKQSIAKLCDAPEFWGIDSSLLHLARLAGLRSVSYWGPTDPSTLLRPSWSVDEIIHYRKIACSPCVHTSETPPCRGDNRCIQGLFAPERAPLHWTPMELAPARPHARPIGRNPFSFAWRNIGFLCVAAVLLYCVVHAFDAPRLNWGDSGTDYNVMTAGRNFAKYGFLKMRLTPVLLDASLVHSNERHLIYTHYPQLPDLMNGVWRVVFRMTDLVQFRFVALAFSFVSLFFAYRLIAAYWSRTAAQIALALWVLNPLWIQHADYLHHIPYVYAFGLGSVYCFRRHLVEGRGSWLWASGILLSLTYMSSYDYWVFMPVVLALVGLAHYHRVERALVKRLAVLAGFAVLALAFKIATNMWALGGPAAWLNDLRFQIALRGTPTVTGIPYTAGIRPVLVGRVERFFTLLLFPVAAFWTLLPLIKRRWPNAFASPAVRWNPIWLLIAAVPFLALFPMMWVEQYYPTLLVLPFYAVGCAIVATLLLDAPKRLVRVAGGVFVFALIVNSIQETLTFPKATFDRESIQSLKAELDGLTGPTQVIQVDHVFDYLYRYYFNHLTNHLIMVPVNAIDHSLARAVETDRQLGHPTIFVEDKHVERQLWDKWIYPLFAKYGVWQPLAYPERYHEFIDSVLVERDSQLVSHVRRYGRKVAETNTYIVWRIDSMPPEPPMSAADALPSKHETHLAKVER